MTTATPDFTALSASDQRAVAERLLAIENSGWKPFWCPDANCDGMPHPAKTPHGAIRYVHHTATAGPNGEPVSDHEVIVFRKGKRKRAKYIVDPKWSHNHARADQRLPPWRKPWKLFIMSGRGSGKTRTGVEFVTLCARKGLDGAIVGRRGTELENTHVRALIDNAHPEFKPTYYASKDILVWPEVTLPDGSKKNPTTYLFSAERPENIRSVNLSYCWFDEAAFMDEVETAWMNAKLATRIETPGNPIHILITSTPSSTPWVMEMEDDPDIEVRRVSTYANKANLSRDFLDDLAKKYEGTRLGRQELHGEVLRDVEGALWNDSMFEHFRVDADGFADLVDSMDDTVVAIDPAGSKTKRSDETGIIGAGVQYTDETGERLRRPRLYVLADGTIKGSPNAWAERAFAIARIVRAQRIIAEKNFGGDMVKQVLSDFAALNPEKALDEDGENYRIVVEHATKSKETRAEGTVGRYEQGTVTHVISPGSYGDMSMLEKEQVGWVPKSRGGKSPSPNRIDALVWASRNLDTGIKHTTQTASRDVQSQVKRAYTKKRAVRVPTARRAS